MDKIFKLVILLILSSCSLNPNSNLWTKNKKIEYEKSLNIIEIDTKKNVLTEEINSNIKIISTSDQLKIEEAFEKLKSLV